MGQPTKIITKRKVLIDKESVHFKIASWSLKNPKATKMALLGLFFLIVITSASFYVLGSHKRSNGEVGLVTVFTNNKPAPQNNSWQVVSKQKKSDTFECYRYRKANGSEMTSCYEWNGSSWNVVTSY